MSYFKYVSEDIALKILQNQTIRITQASQLNDPYEVLPQFDFSKSINNRKRKVFLKEIETLLPKSQDYETAHRIIWRALNNEINILSEELNFNYVVKILQNLFGVLSMTDSPNNILMWSHYSNNHKDVVIEFDENHDFFKQDYFGIPQKVKYLNKRSKISTSQLKLNDLYKYKSKLWKYENEIRMVVPVTNSINFKDRIFINLKDGNDYNIYLLNVPKDLIKAVYFGASADFVHLSEIKIKIVATLYENYPNVKIFQGKVSDDNYSIIFDDVTKWCRTYI